MIQTIDKHDFINAFKMYNRFDQFGREALELLFDYLEELEADTGVPLKLDVIALCCDYSHDTFQEIIRDYNLEYAEDSTAKELRNIARAYLEENTSIVGETQYGFVYCTSF